MDAGDPANLTLISDADGFFSSRRVALNGSGLALVAPDFGRTLELYSSADPANTNAFLTRFDLTGIIQDVAVSRGIGFAAVGNRLEVINYRPFDAQGVAPTVSLTTTAADADPDTAGTQVIEGGTVFLRAAVADDVQARSVEWLVNGTVAGTDVAFPFDFAADIPALAAGGPTTVTLQVRATDTGGNVAVSDLVTLAVVPDTFPPTVASIDPPAGSRRVEGQRFVRVRFSEPLDPAGVNVGTFTLVNGAGTPVAADLQLRDNGRLVQLTVPAPGLSPGDYQLRIDAAAVRDRARNPLGTAPQTTTFTVVEFDQSAEFLPFGSDVSLRQDDNSFEISPMPFAFEFFGQNVSDGRVFVTTNGVVEFGQDTVGGSFSNFGLPIGSNRRVVMPFWDDLDPRNAGRIGLYDADGVRAITFLDVPYFSNTVETVSFQVAFFSNGQIQFRYGRVDPLQRGNVTVGLSDGTSIAVPSLGAIQNAPDVAITDAAGLMNQVGLDALNADEQNDLLVFSPDGSGGYTIALNPGR